MSHFRRWFYVLFEIPTDFEPVRYCFGRPAL